MDPVQPTPIQDQFVWDDEAEQIWHELFTVMVLQIMQHFEVYANFSGLDEESNEVLRERLYEIQETLENNLSYTRQRVSLYDDVYSKSEKDQNATKKTTISSWRSSPTSLSPQPSQQNTVPQFFDWRTASQIK